MPMPGDDDKNMQLLAMPCCRTAAAARHAALLVFSAEERGRMVLGKASVFCTGGYKGAREDNAAVTKQPRSKVCVVWVQVRQQGEGIQGQQAGRR